MLIRKKKHTECFFILSVQKNGVLLPPISILLTKIVRYKLLTRPITYKKFLVLVRHFPSQTNDVSRTAEGIELSNIN